MRRKKKFVGLMGGATVKLVPVGSGMLVNALETLVLRRWVFDCRVRPMTIVGHERRSLSATLAIGSVGEAGGWGEGGTL